MKQEKRRKMHGRNESKEREKRKMKKKLTFSLSLTLEESDFTWIKSRETASWQMRGSRDCLEHVA